MTSRVRLAFAAGAVGLGFAAWTLLRDASERPQPPGSRDPPGTRDPSRAGPVSLAPPVLATAQEDARAPASVPDATRPAPAPASGVIEGRVRWAGPTAPPGVRLQAIPKSAPKGAAGVPGGGVPVAADGSFRIEGLGEGPYRVVARSGPRTEEMEVMADVVPGGAPVEVTLPTRGGPLAIGRGVDEVRTRIEGPNGEPVARATVVAWRGKGFAGFAEVTDGGFSRAPGFEGWDTAYEVYGAVGLSGEPLPFGPAVARAHALGPDATIRLTPERVVTGRVVGSDGGVAGVEIHASPASNPAPGPLPVRHGSATTAQDGGFRLGMLGEGTYRILPERLPESLMISSPWTVEAGARDVVLRLGRAVAVTLRVLDADGRPLPGATVLLGGLAEGGTPRPVPRTDADGFARVASLDPAGSYALVVGGPPDRRDLHAVRVDGWKPADATFTLERGFVVSGTVRDDRGNPVRASIYEKLPDGRRRPWGGSLADGTFSIGPLPRGPVTLSATLGPGQAHGPETTVEAGTTGVVLVTGAPPPR